jgi:hypothetical protein
VPPCAGSALVAAEITPLVCVHGLVPASNPPLTSTWSPHTAAAAGLALSVTPANPSTRADIAANGLRLIGRPFLDNCRATEKRDPRIPFVQRHVFAC